VIQNIFSLANPIRKISVPGRLPRSEEEWREFNAQWPTTYSPNTWLEFLESERKLAQCEVEQMRRGLQAAIDDAHALVMNSTGKGKVGTVIFDPKSGRIIGRATDERVLQQQQYRQGDYSNPLATSILYAIQSVSRLERERAFSQGVDSANFQGGQYLCTGYDVYTTHEPSVFEAMALVHSRIRRLVIGCTSSSGNGGLTSFQVHSLPGTNHKYRVFCCRHNDDLRNRCLELGS
jgi:tRNA(Arg) A34 adenosine deaminase TadA